MTRAPRGAGLNEAASVHQLTAGPWAATRWLKSAAIDD